MQFSASFKALGEQLQHPHAVLVFHLAPGDEEEKILYQFLSMYQQAHKMLILINVPVTAQGMRMYRAGIKGYCNTYLTPHKLMTAIKVVEQGKVWMGSEILKKLLDCGLEKKEETEPEQKTPPRAMQIESDSSNTPSSATVKPQGLLDVVFQTLKKIFR